MTVFHVRAVKSMISYSVNYLLAYEVQDSNLNIYYSDALIE